MSHTGKHNIATTFEHVTTWPTQAEIADGVDLWDIMPAGASDRPGILGKRVRITIEVLDDQRGCICNAQGDCDDECIECEGVEYCQAC